MSLNEKQFKDVIRVGNNNVDVSHVAWPITVSVPSKFLNDHIGRSDHNNQEHWEGRLPITWGNKMSKVTLHRSHFEDLATDADYYANPEGEDDYFKQWSGSAKNTVTKLLKSVNHTQEYKP